MVENEKEVSIVYVVFAYSELNLHRNPNASIKSIDITCQNHKTGLLFMLKLATHTTHTILHIYYIHISMVWNVKAKCTKKPL